MSDFRLPGPALLFAPANRPEFLPKAAARADMVIMDLEDGAGNVDRELAYEAIATSGLDPQRACVRVVGPHDPNHQRDLEFVHTTPYRTVIIPKVTGSLEQGPLLDDLHIIPIIESPRVLRHLDDIAADPRVVGLYWGADDLTIELGGLSSRYQADEPNPGHYRSAVRHVRTLTLIAAAAHGKWAIDAVYQDFKDTDGLYLEALDSARSGFAAYPCIHPTQVPVVRRAFAPTDEQRQWAERVAAESTKHPGAFKLDDEMVDTPLITLAHRLLSRVATPEA